MGQKVHPNGLRLGFIRHWQSKWYDERNYAKWLHEDLAIRDFIKKEHFNTGISRSEIERAANKVKVNVYTAKPGILIGRRGSGVEALKGHLQKLTSGEVFLNIQEVRKPELDAQLVAENVAGQLVRRVSFRRAMKKAVASTMKFGALGMKIMCAGRLGGAEMARREWYREGQVPLHTLRADVDYGFTSAKTTYGTIGVKVWIFKGEVQNVRSFI